jgi:hypothetical protein
MVEIKGAVILDSFHAVKTRSGEEIYNGIIRLLDEQTRKLFKKNIIIASGWYPLDAFLQFVKFDIKLTANGNENELISRSEAIIEDQLKGIFKAFVKLGSPEFVLKRIAIVHKTYFRGVSIDIRMEGSNKAIIKYTGFEKQHRLIGLTIIGFYKKAMEISGAKNVEAKFAVPIEDDKGYSELEVTWTGK